MKLHQLFLAAVACSWALGASAQWQWLDKDGRKVFSDRPPPTEVPEKNILRQPMGSKSISVPRILPPEGDAKPATAPATAKAETVKTGAADKAPAEEKPSKEQAAEEAKKKAQEKAEAERQAKARADNCGRAQRAKISLESGAPMAHINDKGERVFMDEATRNAELRRAQQLIDSDCAK